MPLSTYMKLTDERPAKTDIRLFLASHSYIYPLGTVKDVLVEVVEHVYPIDFVILDIREDEKRPFILETPFLTTAKAVIKFDKGTITLRSGKSKISFHRTLEPLCKGEKGIKNDIEPIAPTMTVNRLVLEWEERIRLHQEKEMEFDQRRSKNFNNKNPALIKVEGGMDDEGEVMSIGIGIKLYECTGSILNSKTCFYDAFRDRIKTVVVTYDPLALITEKTKVRKSKEKVVVSLDSEGSGSDDFSELKKITALLAKAFNRRKFYSKPTNNNLRTSSTSQSANKKQEFVKNDNKKVEKKDDEKK
nr:hypothetical protein [Tanacetum cinerariifolium]